MGKLEIGQEAEVELVAGGTATGRIRYIAPAADSSTRTFRVEIVIDNKDGAIRDGIAGADEAERRRLAHTLKGSARSVGAFALADCAQRIEVDPFDRASLSRLAALIGEVRDFIAAISR